VFGVLSAFAAVSFGVVEMTMRKHPSQHQQQQEQMLLPPMFELEVALDRILHDVNFESSFQVSSKLVDAYYCDCAKKKQNND
jgi:hypothetical protein